MKIITKNVEDLTPVEYRACKAANYGPDGGTMWYGLVHAREQGGDGTKAILLWEGPEDSVRSLRGWALISPINSHTTLEVTAHGRRMCKYVAQFWVKRQYRRKGYGTVLVDEVYKHDSRPYVYVHSKATGKLFQNRKFSTIEYYLANVIRSKPMVS